MNIQPIRNATDHERAMTRLLACLENDPAPGSEAADEAEVLATLIETYEDKQFPIELPSPIDAIRFRMDQLDMAQKDLAPYIGSQSKVSEVLNGKRRLSLAMIQRLYTGLGIPAEVLIAETPHDDIALCTDDLPLKEMHKRQYFHSAPASFRDFKKQAAQWVAGLLDETNSPGQSISAFARSSGHYRNTRTMAHLPFEMWQAKVLREAHERPSAAFNKNLIDEAFLQKLAGLSVEADGPIQARDLLESHGIRVVIEPHLSKTYLDGAALLTANGPVIGLTLRHDRLDNFWFTLLHEVVHVGWHLNNEQSAFFDELEGHTGELDAVEAEADRLAGQALIDEAVWCRELAPPRVTKGWVTALADRLGRHPAIIAGRVRRDRQDYRLLWQLVGNRQVRVLFAD